MIILIMRQLYLILSLLLIFSSISKSDEKFSTWLENYKKYAINQGVSKKTVNEAFKNTKLLKRIITCLLYTSPSPRDRTRSRMPSSA